MMISHIEKGRFGEKFTEKYLKKQRYKIISKNMRNQFSEIDIIAENREYIIFVEVKTRTEGHDILPSEAVNLKKQQKILKAASMFIKQYDIKKQPRFDVAEVYLIKESLKVSKINYIENAFFQGGKYAAF